jgi:FixJ family two-component response regulator
VLKTQTLISVVDDDESMREAISGLMKSLGYTAVAFASAEGFLSSRQIPRTSCLITDVQMPGMTGLELHRRLLAAGKTIPTILITAYPDDSAREGALGDGVVCYLSKPFDENELLACIDKSLNT